MNCAMSMRPRERWSASGSSRVDRTVVIRPTLERIVDLGFHEMRCVPAADFLGAPVVHDLWACCAGVIGESACHRRAGWPCSQNRSTGSALGRCRIVGFVGFVGWSHGPAEHRGLIGDFVAARDYAEQAMALFDPPHPSEAWWTQNPYVTALTFSFRSLTYLGEAEIAGRLKQPRPDLSLLDVATIKKQPQAGGAGAASAKLVWCRAS
jgi:hypothetical protein